MEGYDITMPGGIHSSLEKILSSGHGKIHTDGDIEFTIKVRSQDLRTVLNTIPKDAIFTGLRVDFRYNAEHKAIELGSVRENP